MSRTTPISTSIPLPLHPYLSLPAEQALILFTSVLGASTNWLVLRAICGVLLSSNRNRAAVGTGSDRELGSGGDGVRNGTDSGEGKVVLVSFLRDARFWGEGGRRLGLDLDRLSREKRFTFVDGLSALFLPDQSARKPSTASGLALAKVLKSPILDSIYTEISSAVKDLNSGDGDGSIVLVIDGLDALLAAVGEGISVGEVEEMVIRLREEVYATIMILSADAPLVSSQQTPLETNHAALVLGVAHQADFIMSLRLLDTGTARDISGVIRVTLGEEAEVDDGLQLEGKELLYFVGGDGGVKVFERGQSG